MVAYTFQKIFFSFKYSNISKGGFIFLLSNGFCAGGGEVLVLYRVSNPVGIGGRRIVSNISSCHRSCPISVHGSG